MRFATLTIDERALLNGIRDAGFARYLKEHFTGDTDRELWKKRTDAQVLLLGIFERWRGAFKSFLIQESLSEDEEKQRSLCVREIFSLFRNEKATMLRGMILQIALEHEVVPAASDALYEYWVRMAPEISFSDMQTLCAAIILPAQKDFAITQISSHDWDIFSAIFIDDDGDFDPRSLSLCVLMTECNEFIPHREKLGELASALADLRQVLKNPFRYRGQP